MLATVLNPALAPGPDPVSATSWGPMQAAIKDGEEIVIARKGVPVARLVSAAPASRKFVLGQHSELIPLDILDDWEEDDWEEDDWEEDDWEKTDAEIRKMFADYLPDPE